VPIQLLIRWVQGFLSWKKAAACGFDDPPPSSVEVKNVGNYTSTPHVCVGVMDKGKITF